MEVDDFMGKVADAIDAYMGGVWQKDQEEILRLRLDLIDARFDKSLWLAVGFVVGMLFALVLVWAVGI
jgi:hypothetical protein